MRIIVISISIIISITLVEFFSGYLLNKDKALCKDIDHKPLGESISFSQVNYHYKPFNKVVHCNKEWLYTYEIDENGFRKTNKNKNKRILAIGDSQTFGFGVSDEMSWTNLLGAYNAGLWGCPINYQNKSLKRSIKIVNPDVIVWNIYTPHIITLMKSAWHDFCPGTKKVSLNPFNYFILNNLNFLELRNSNIAKFFFKRLHITNINIINKNLIIYKDCYSSKEKILYIKNLKDYKLSNIENFNKVLMKDFDNSMNLFYKEAKEIVELSKNKKLIVWFLPSKTQLKMDFEDVEYDKENIDTKFLIENITKKLINFGVNKKNIFNLKNYMNSEDYLSYYFIDDAHLNEKGNDLLYKILETKIN
jgi:hypothetical protein